LLELEIGVGNLDLGFTDEQIGLCHPLVQLEQQAGYHSPRLPRA
jgi:hypothetical protein